MADAGNPEGGSHESFGFLTKKVGPIPVWMWAAIAVAGYYWYTHYGPGAKTAAATAAATGQTSTETDQSNTPAQPGTAYKTNAEWETSAVSFLVGKSIPATEASQAIWNYLHSKPLTAQEQKDVNLAIQGIGPPPTIPGPGTVTKPPPVKHPRKPPHRRQGPPPHHIPDPDPGHVPDPDPMKRPPRKRPVKRSGPPPRRENADATVA